MIARRIRGSIAALAAVLLLAGCGGQSTPSPLTVASGDDGSSPTFALEPGDYRIAWSVGGVGCQNAMALLAVYDNWVVTLSHGSSVASSPAAGVSIATAVPDGNFVIFAGPGCRWSAVVEPTRR